MGMNNSTLNITCCGRRSTLQIANDPGQSDAPAGGSQYSSYALGTNTTIAVRTPQYEKQEHYFPTSIHYKTPPPSLSLYTDFPQIFDTSAHCGSTSRIYERVVQTPQSSDSQERDLPTSDHHKIPHPFSSTSSDLPSENDQLLNSLAHHWSTSDIYTSDHSPRTMQSCWDSQSIPRASSPESEWHQMSNLDLIGRSQIRGGNTSAETLVPDQDQDQTQNTPESTPDSPQEGEWGIKQIVKQLKGKGKILVNLPVSPLPPWLNRFTKAQDQLEQLPHRNMPSFL